MFGMRHSARFSATVSAGVLLENAREPGAAAGALKKEKAALAAWLCAAETEDRDKSAAEATGGRKLRRMPRAAVRTVRQGLASINFASPFVARKLSHGANLRIWGCILAIDFESGNVIIHRGTIAKLSEGPREHQQGGACHPIHCEPSIHTMVPPPDVEGCPVTGQSVATKRARGVRGDFGVTSEAEMDQTGESLRRITARCTQRPGPACHLRA